MYYIQYIYNFIFYLIYNVKNLVNNSNNNYTIYCLKLENDKYYIGRTLDYNKRIKQHFNNEGSLWTQKHKPINIYGIKNNCDAFDEDKWVKILMAKYGILNVRGGSYSRLNFDSYTISLLENEINGALDTCFLCGQKHFSNKCNKKTCYRCGRSNHSISKCYAKKDINGKYL